MPIYMKYEGIEGPVTGRYSGWIELESCQFGGVNKGVSSHERGEGSRDGASISNIFVTKLLDSASVHLMREAARGEPRRVFIEFVENDGSAPFFSIELEGTLISSYNLSGSGSSGNKAIESISLNFTKISQTVKPTSSSSDPKNANNKSLWNVVTQ